MKHKGKLKVPGTYVLIACLIIVFTVLTYFIPAGVYNTVEGSTNIDPSTFHYVENTPVSLWDMLQSVFSGMQKQSSIILFVFLIGGYFQVFTDTRAIDSAVNKLVQSFGSKSMLAIPVIMFLMSAFGASGAIANAAVAFVPLGLVLAKKLKLDPVCAVAFTFLACFSGFGTSPICPVTVQLAQEIAEVPILSGTGFRTVAWLILMSVTIWYVMRYSKKVASDPSKSVFEKIEFPFMENESGGDIPFGIRQVIILIVIASGFGVYIYGALTYGWDTGEMAAVMLATAVISGLIAGMTPEEISRSFVNGCKSMTFGALVVGFASAISIVITDGQIIHTIVHAVCTPLEILPSAISAVAMLFINIAGNFFVPSGSGQAALIMPLTAPMADVIGFSRQIAVCAYQWGDGISNTLIPTTGTLMASLGVAKVPYEKWVKFFFPLFCIWIVLGSAALAFMALLGIQ